MTASENIANLVEEYKSILEPAATRVAGRVSHDTDNVEELLIAKGEWTSSAAGHLLRLSKDYGSFMLRNALALALALGIEDGSLGF
jgi:hypothetical protein